MLTQRSKFFLLMLPVIKSTGLKSSFCSVISSKADQLLELCMLNRDENCGIMQALDNLWISAKTEEILNNHSHWMWFHWSKIASWFNYSFYTQINWLNFFHFHVIIEISSLLHRTANGRDCIDEADCVRRF